MRKQARVALGLASLALALMPLAGCDIGAANDTLNAQEQAREAKIATPQEQPPGLSVDYTPAPAAQATPQQ